MQKGCGSNLTDEDPERPLGPAGGVGLAATWSADPGGDPRELLRQCVKPTSPVRRRLPSDIDLHPAPQTALASHEY